MQIPNKNQCSLCLRNIELCESHLIPKFISNWMKETSATGFFRMVVNPNLRLQDPFKKKLLCSDCEIKFSKNETYFANNIFYPHVDKKLTKIKPDQKIKKFIVSVNWRMLSNSFQEEKIPLWGKSIIKDCLEDLRQYLNNEKKDCHYENHIFFLGPVEGASTGVIMPKGFNQYLLRAIDSTVVFRKPRFLKPSILLQYTKFPFFILVTLIKPKKNKKWVNTLVSDGGISLEKQRIKDRDFGSFLLERAKLSMSHLDDMSQKQNNVIIKSLLKNSTKVLTSRSYEAFLADEALEKQQIVQRNGKS